MFQFYPIVKGPRRNQIPKSRPIAKPLHAVPMGRCQQSHPGESSLPCCQQLVLPGQLIHCHDLRIHNPKHQLHALRLGTPGQHIGTGSKIQHVLSVPLRRQFPPLVDDADPVPRLTI